MAQMIVLRYFLYGYLSKKKKEEDISCVGMVGISLVTCILTEENGFSWDGMMGLWARVVVFYRVYVLLGAKPQSLTQFFLVIGWGIEPFHVNFLLMLSL